MTIEQLIEVMIFHLKSFNKKKVDISEDTIHSEVVSTKDGFGNANSQNIYRGVVRWTLKNAKKKDKPWPRNWTDLSVRALAEKIIVLLMFFSTAASAQNLEVNLGTVKTDLRNNALTIGVKYLQSFDSIWKNQDYLFAGKQSLFMLSPEAVIQTGTEDAFSSIVVKATGLFMKFKTTTVSGITTPNTGATFHVFPISLGVESNNLFNNINGLIEAGWVPWYQAETRNTPEFIKRTKLGFFLQAGYKFVKDTSGLRGGEVDGSQEQEDRTILRAKGSFAIDLATVKIGAFNVGILGTADGWFDAVNSAFYHRVDGRARVYLTETQYLDLIYQKGSGAPLFNTGDQFGVGLTLMF